MNQKFKLNFIMKKFIGFCILVTLVASFVHGDVLKVGNFTGPEKWKYLKSCNIKTSEGYSCAKSSSLINARFDYAKQNEFLGWDTPAFSDMLDEISVGNWFDYRYVEFDVKLPRQGAYQMKFTASPIRIGRPDFMDEVSTVFTINYKGWNRVLLELRDFDYPHHIQKHWKYIDSVSITGRYTDGSNDGDVLISQPRLKKGKIISISSDVLSKPVKPGEQALYTINVSNESGVKHCVKLLIEDTAWQACSASLSHSDIELAPFESRQVILSVDMNLLVAPGGREGLMITAVPDARADLSEKILFTTVRFMPHPYLLLDQRGWDAVEEKTEKYEWAASRKQEYIEQGKSWRKPALRSGSYCYRLDDAINLENAAIAWKLSGDKQIEQKVISFLKDFSNPETGYLSKLRSNNGSHVHEGMFFIHVARAYDLLYDSGMLSIRDHKNVEETFRGYFKWLKPGLLTGDGNNHQVSLASGAILCGLAIQDFDVVNHFLSGTGGYRDLMSAGILDDGNYFEGTANYNILTANLAASIAVATEPWGLNVKDWHFKPKYGKFVMVSDWARRGDFLGMSFEKVGPSTRNYRCAKDLWDAILRMSDYRGALFASSDSIEIDLTTNRDEAGFGFDMAYYLYKDKDYIPVIKLKEKRDLLYGAGELPQSDYELGKESYHNDNVGFSVLRSQSEGRSSRERIQAVQRYGTHGGYHGHFDKTALNSLMRYGRSFYGTEASWYGYGSFMFKMWVQSSMAHNIVVVDDRMQRPADSSLLLFYSGDMMRVSATEIETTWIDPPYGGQTPYAMSMPQEKSWQERKWLPIPEVIRPQGDIGKESEAVLQRRAIVLTDDYLVVADYIKSENEHNFDNLFHCKGLVGFEAEAKEFTKHTQQMDSDPYSAAQFITNCEWFTTSGIAKFSFDMDFNNPGFLERVPTSLPGRLKVDYYSLWPVESEVMVGNYADSQDVARHLYYKVIADDRVIADNKLAPWILGSSKIDVDVEGVKFLEIETKIDKAKELKTIFLGDPYIETVGGEKVYLCDMPLDYENIAPAAAKGCDYYGNKVTIFGNDYSKPLAAEPADRDRRGRIKIDLSKLNARRLKAVIGGDYPAKSEYVQRKTIALRQTGKEASFITIIEPYENDNLIQSAVCKDGQNIVIELADGQVQKVNIAGLSSLQGDIKVSIEDFTGKTLVRSETTKTKVDD